MIEPSWMGRFFKGDDIFKSSTLGGVSGVMACLPALPMMQEAFLDRGSVSDCYRAPACFAFGGVFLPFWGVCFALCGAFVVWGGALPACFAFIPTCGFK